jgi:hypothetical protein
MGADKIETHPVQGVGELVAFLYARSFPEKEWRMRVDEALRGMENFT